jgi:putative inorganic carbon (hco3(-)) transporter
MTTSVSTITNPGNVGNGPGQTRGQRLLWLLAAAGVGLAALAGVIALEGSDYKVWVVAMAAVLSLPLLVVLKRARVILLFCWVFALSYNRQYFVFESLVGYQGTSGPYVMLADICLAGLLGLWLYDRTRRGPAAAIGRSFWPWFLPFAAACFLSVFVADRTDWALFEMLRIVKMGVLLAYIRHNFGRAEWMTCVLALSLAISFQSAVAIKEVATQKQGVIGSQDLAEESGEEDLASHFEGGKFYGMIRGVGTLAHPPYLACFLLLGMPPLLALALTARRRRAMLCGIAFLIACGGMVCTMSRFPAILAVGQIVVVVVALAGMRILPVKHALGVTILTLFIAALAVLPFEKKIMDRMKGDFDESVQYRWDGFDAAVSAIEDHPFLGLGLNNTKLHFHKYLPAFDWAFSTEDFATHLLHLRAPVAFSNGFLFIGEQTGVIGFVAFLIFVGGALVTGVWATARTSGEPRVICLGLVVGMLGALGEQIIDTPLWVDPNLYIFTLFAGMVCVAPQIFAEPRASRVALEKAA